ncbi:MAG: hypothetical protein FWE21_05545 [Defluviitaleaceae bacterium]|nr:hypothetical protein [Defluviitaleaceae bacterium]
MTRDGEIVGFFAVHNTNTLTLFYVMPNYAGRSQEIFARTKKMKK